MAKGGSEARVGLFVVVVLAAAAYMILSIQGNPFEKTFHLKALYSRVGGVKIGTVVTLAGHQIGKVDGVRANVEKRKVEVDMVLAQEYEGALLTDATASIIPLGFLGDVMVEITYGRLGVPVRDGDVLEGMDPMDLSSIIQGAAGDFRTTMGSVNDVVGNQEFQDDLGEILENLASFTETLDTLVVPEDKGDLDELFALLRDTTASIGQAADNINLLIDQNRDDFNASVGNVREITDQVKGEIAPDFAEASKNFAELGEKMSDLTDRIDTFVVSNSDNAAEMITNIKEAAGAFEKTLETATSSLTRIEEGPGSLHNFIYEDSLDRELRGTLRSATGFFDTWSGLGTGVELKLSAETQWFFDDPDDFHSERDFRVDTFNPPPPFSVEGTTDVWREADNNRVEMDIAGQIWFENYGLLLGVDDVGAEPELDLLFLGKIPNTGDRLVAGFGVIEGEAGLRLEAHLVPDLLSLRLDAVGFTTEDQERLDVSLRGQIWENIHVIGGVEGVIGTPKTRGFAGLRLEFGKKFGEKDALDEDDWDPEYDSEVYDDLFDSPPTKSYEGKDPFADDDELWSEEIELIPVEEAPTKGL